MLSYNTQLQSNNTGLQAILNTINNLPLNEYSENEDALLEGTLSGSYKNVEVTTVGMYAFRDYSQSLEVEFPNCNSVGAGAFYNATGLKTASFAHCSFIDTCGFYSCSKLQTAFFPNCQSLSSAVFYKCNDLTNITFPVCKTAESAAFYHCSNLTDVSLPQCETIANHAFYSCINLFQISLPACKTTGSYAFGRCSALTQVSLPACTSLSSGTFNECWGLTTVNLPVCQFIGGMGIRYCSKLSDIRLGASTICTLEKSNALESTPFTGYSVAFSGTPHIYVPASLITAYQSATNWVYFSSYFSAIESLPITFTIDGVEYQAENGMTWAEWFNSEYSQGHSLATINSSGTQLGCAACGEELYYLREVEDEIRVCMVYTNYTITPNEEYLLKCDCNLITFTINGTTYRAMEGMTWGEWVESEYSLGEYGLNDDGSGHLTVQQLSTDLYVIDKNDRDSSAYSFTLIKPNGVYSATGLGEW